MDWRAQVLSALAVLCIVLSVIVKFLSDDEWAKVVSAVTGFLTIIFGGVGLYVARRE